VGEGTAPGFGITDQAKLDRLAAEFGVAADLPPLAKAKELALAMMEEYGIKKGYLTFTRRLPAARLEKWRKLGIDPRGVDWEVTEMLHRTHMGVDNDAVSLLVQALRCALADGWGGSMIATEISDVLFGTPKPTTSQVNLAVLKADQVNLILHGYPWSPRWWPGPPRTRSWWPGPRHWGPKASIWSACAAPATKCSCARASPWPATTWSRNWP
jgi:carbon-monoxide dehydrogenase catalytic subunit